MGSDAKLSSKTPSRVRQDPRVERGRGEGSRWGFDSGSWRRLWRLREAHKGWMGSKGHRERYCTVAVKMWRFLSYGHCLQKGTHGPGPTDLIQLVWCKEKQLTERIFRRPVHVRSTVGACLGPAEAGQLESVLYWRCISRAWMLRRYRETERKQASQGKVKVR